MKFKRTLLIYFCLFLFGTFAFAADVSDEIAKQLKEVQARVQQMITKVSELEKTIQQIESSSTSEKPTKKVLPKVPRFRYR